MGFLFSSILCCLGGHTSPDEPQTGHSAAIHRRQLVAMVKGGGRFFIAVGSEDGEAVLGLINPLLVIIASDHEIACIVYVFAWLQNVECCS